MIRRLRTKFIIITMALMAALLFAILSIVCYSTWWEMDQKSTAALQVSAFEPWDSDGMPPEAADPNFPCFVLCIDGRQHFHTAGHRYYNLSDEEELRQIFREAQAQDEPTGYLWDRGLKYTRVELWSVEEYVFTDISFHVETMRILYVNCSLVFLAAMVIFFFISWGLSRWMVRPVERALEQQRQFVADASHELKTPLTVILTNSELLTAPDPVDRQCCVLGIRTAAEQMRGLVNGLLELAKSEDRTKLPKVATDFSHLADMATLLFEPLYFEAGRTLVSTVPPKIMVNCPAEQLQQVLDILLDNGMKYADPGSTVFMRLEKTRGHCLLTVTSQGPTLTGKQCRDIFKRFYRVDTARSMNHSYGLGLAIAQSIVEGQRGKIWAESREGTNRFFVKLPTCSKK